MEIFFNPDGLQNATLLMEGLGLVLVLIEVSSPTASNRAVAFLEKQSSLWGLSMTEVEQSNVELRNQKFARRYKGMIVLVIFMIPLWLAIYLEWFTYLSFILLFLIAFLIGTLMINHLKKHVLAFSGLSMGLVGVTTEVALLFV